MKTDSTLRSYLRIIFFHLLLAMAPMWTAAQSAPIDSAAVTFLDFEQFFKQVDQNPAYQQAILQTEIHREELNETRTQRIPVFYIDANLHRNLIIPTTPVPAIAFDQNAADGAVIPLKFATKWSAKAGVQLEWSLFDPARSANQEERKLHIRKAEIQQQQIRQDRQRDAALAYASVVLASHQYESARQDSAIYAEILSVSKARFEAGRELSSSYISASQEFERVQIRLHEAWSVLMESNLELRKFIDLSGTVVLTTGIDSVKDHVRAIPSANHTIGQMMIDQQLAKTQTRRINRGFLPSLTVNAYLGEQYFSNEFRLDRGNEWFGNSFVNLVLRIPISDYFTAAPYLRKAQLEHRLSSIALEQEQRENLIDLEQSTIKIEHALQKTERLKRIKQLALQAASENEAAYREGRMLLSEYNRSLTEANQAKQDVWQAEYHSIALLLELISRQHRE